MLGLVDAHEELGAGEDRARAPAVVERALELAVALDEHEAELVAMRALAKLHRVLDARVRKAGELEARAEGAWRRRGAVAAEDLGVVAIVGAVVDVGIGHGRLLSMAAG